VAGNLHLLTKQNAGWKEEDRLLRRLKARPMFSVEKWLFSVTLSSGGTFSSTAIEIIKWVNFFAEAKVCGDLRLD
jgi:hypothetical protein